MELGLSVRDFTVCGGFIYISCGARGAGSQSGKQSLSNFRLAVGIDRITFCVFADLHSLKMLMI